MKQSDLEEAAKLVSKNRLYRSMLDKLFVFPGYDAVLEVDGNRLCIERGEAGILIQSYIDRMSDDAARIGLEFD
jgi:hypothetical protein